VDAGYAVGVAVGATALVAFLARGLQFLVRIERQFGPDEDGKSLRDRMRAVEKALNNGLRSEVRQALTEAAQARRLAGDAAKAASLAEQRASEGRTELQRAINAMRAEMNALTNVALTDHADIWSALSEAGLDRRSGGHDRPAT
jgi:hypothetical protein